MGKFYSNSISSTDPTTRITSLSEWFNNIDGISSEVIDYEYDDIEYTAARITINNTDIEVLYGVQKTDVQRSILHAKNGDISLVSDTSKKYGDPNDIVLYSYVHENKVALIAINTPNSSTDGANSIELLFVRDINSNALIGYKYHADTDTFVDISDLVFENVADSSRAQYTYAEMFPYAAISPTFDYLAQGYFKNSLGYKSFTSDILKECSVITVLDTATLPDPLGNHIAIGEHCIVPIDIEEEDE